MCFKKKSDKVMNKVMEAVDKVNESTKTEPVKPAEEWIWVKGYKATESDMTCRGYQYELNKQFDISDDKEIEVCEHGFHFCKELSDVYRYYEIENGHRFFEVKALVRKSDYEAYGQGGWEFRDGHVVRTSTVYKLVAKSIVFTRELTVDELVTRFGADIWSDEDKKRIIDLGFSPARDYVQTRDLVNLGYSEMFARMVVKGRKYDIAKAVATQPDLSMDMKCWLIFK